MMKVTASAVRFELTPCVPYAWQCKGQTIETPTAKGKRFAARYINVAGFFSKKNAFLYYLSESTINTEKLVEIFNDFAKKITKNHCCLG